MLRRRPRPLRAPSPREARPRRRLAGRAGNKDKLLGALAGVAEEKRGARFVCVLALYAPAAAGGGEWLFRAECAGRIAPAPRGENGFGYDPLFFYPPAGSTFGELDRAAKRRVSHRGRALEKFAAAVPGLPPFKRNS